MTTPSKENRNRTAPYNLDAELALLAAVVLDPSRLDEISLSSREFYDEANAAFFAAITTLHDAGKPIHDLVVLVPSLRQLGVSESLWPNDAIAALFRKGIAMNAGYYAAQIRRCGRLRRLLELAEELVRRVHSQDADDGEISNWLDTQLDVIDQGRQTQSRIIGEIAKDVLDDLDIAGSGIERGVTTGLASVDDAVGQIMPGELVVIAARPGGGKTSLAVQAAQENARLNRPALIISLEMTEKELTQRLMCSLARVNELRVRNGSLSSRERAKLIEAASTLKGLPLHIWAPPEATTVDIRAIARWHAKTSGLSFVVVDYIGLVRATDMRRPRYEQVSMISAGLKQLAKELDVPVIALCQLNREAEKSNTPPQLSHLRESGSIEQDADLCLFLHHVQDSVVQLIVAKHRHGSTGKVHLNWIGKETRFEDQPSINPVLAAYNQGDCQ